MSEEPKPWSRRKFLKAAGAAATGALLGTYAYQNAPGENTSTPTTPEATEKPREKIVFEDRGVKVWADSETNLPTKWEDRTGTQGQFNKEEIQKIKEEAKREKDIRLVEAKRINALPHPWRDTFETPTRTNEKELDLELPEDVVTNEELKARGIEIINGNNVELSIRKRAFEKGGVLEAFQEGSGHELQIVLVDETIISPMALADPQYEPVQHFVKTQFTTQTQYGVLDSVGKTRAYLIGNLAENIKKEKGEERLEDEKALKLLNSLTDKEIIDWGLYPFVAGYTLPPSDERSGGKYLVLLATGQRKIRIPTLDIKVDKDGKFSYSVSDNEGPTLSSRFQFPDFAGLDQSQTKPKSSDFSKNERGFYDGRTTGFTLEHELQHVRRHTVNPDVNYWSDDEQGVDEDAYKAIKKAEETGYYQFVLKRKDQKGYVLT